MEREIEGCESLVDAVQVASAKLQNFFHRYAHHEGLSHGIPNIINRIFEVLRSQAWNFQVSLLLLCPLHCYVPCCCYRHSPAVVGCLFIVFFVVGYFRSLPSLLVDRIRQSPLFDQWRASLPSLSEKCPISRPKSLIWNTK